MPRSTQAIAGFFDDVTGAVPSIETPPEAPRAELSAEARDVAIQEFFAEEFLQPPGAPTAEERAVGEAGLEQARATSALLAQEGVDVTTGISGEQRMEISLTPPEIMQQSLDAMFGAGRHRETGAGLVVSLPTEEIGPDGQPVFKEFLADERGITPRDFADLTAEGIELGTEAAVLGGVAVAAPALLTGGALSLAGVGVLAAVAGQIPGTIIDAAKIMNTMSDGGEAIIDMAKRRGFRAATNAFLNAATGLTGRAVGEVGRQVRAPFGGAIDPATQQEVAGAFQRLGVEGTPGEVTGHQTLQAAEALRSKLPGARGQFAKAKQRADVRISEIVEEIEGQVGASEQAGRGIIEGIKGRATRLEQQAETLTRQAQQTALDNLDRFRAKMSQKLLSKREAGEATRTSAVVERDKFKQLQGALEMMRH